MTTSAWLLIATTGLLGVGWTLGIHHASRRIGMPAGRATRRTLIAAALFVAWVAVDWFIGASGMLSGFAVLPPPMFVFMVVSFAFVTALGLSPLGSSLARGLPLSWLVGFQGFRILAELALIFAFRDGLAPIQMTFEGYNFDIVTGITAPLVALALVKRESRRLALAWNCLGLALLLAIVIIAILSFPSPIRMFLNEPANTWVTGAPYILLPGILVQFAWLGHLLVFRRLRLVPVQK